MVKITSHLFNVNLITRGMLKITDVMSHGSVYLPAECVCVYLYLSLLPYLSTVDVFHCRFPEEEVNIVVVLHRAHKVRSWKIEKEIAKKNQYSGAKMFKFILRYNIRSYLDYVMITSEIILLIKVFDPSLFLINEVNHVSDIT